MQWSDRGVHGKSTKHGEQSGPVVLELAVPLVLDASLDVPVPRVVPDELEDAAPPEPSSPPPSSLPKPGPHAASQQTESAKAANRMTHGTAHRPAGTSTGAEIHGQDRLRQAEVRLDKVRV